MRRYPGIAFRGDDHRRRAWVLGTALDVWEIVALLRDFGSEGELGQEYGLTPGQIRITVAYYKDLSSHSLLRILGERGHDVVAAGFVDDLRQLDDPILFAVAQEQRRAMITHNAHDFPDILRDWAEAGRSHHGCVVSFLPTNAYGEMSKRFDRWFQLFPTQRDWIDRVVST